MVLALLRAARKQHEPKTMSRRLLYAPRLFKVAKVDMRYQPPMQPPECKPDKPKAWGLTGWEKVEAGDRLWVRENLRCTGSGIWRWEADELDVKVTARNQAACVAWAHHEERGAVPSIHMPRWASRLTLTVTEAKIERLNSITAADVRAEGISENHIRRHEEFFDKRDAAPLAFGALWNDLHGAGAWDANPYVVAMRFDVVEQNLDDMALAA